METVLGAGCVIPPHEGFIPGLRKLCTENGILLIAEEVITGFGRTGDWTGSRDWGVQPDLATFAKAITTEHVAMAFEGDETAHAMIGTGYTYSGHPVDAAVTLACLTETQGLDAPANGKVRGDELFAGLRKLAEKHDIVGDVRGGHGLMCALELVTDRGTKAMVPPAMVARIHEAT